MKKPLPTAAETRQTPAGALTVCSDGTAVTHVQFGTRESLGLPPLTGDDLTRKTFSQLEEYFKGQRKTFTLPLRPEGTPFQKRVWDALCTIPYGSTRTYAQVAAQAGNPKACRAVGMANHNNPIAILIPCHRVVGADGTLTGYAGGLDIKKALLDLEQQGS